MALQDVVRNGLPLHRLTRGHAMMAGLAIAGMLVLGNEIYHFVKKRTTEPTQAAPCFERDSATYTPGRNALPPRGDKVDQRRDAFYITKLKDAERVCTPASCDKAAFEAYRSALFWYLAERMQHMRKLDLSFGEPGITRARELYRSADDLAIEQGLRERYRAKLFRINDSRQHREVKSILIFKGGDAMRPCRKGDV
jgi:hypothetical protein